MTDDPVLKKWEKSGLLDGVADDMRKRLSELYERELKRIVDEHYTHSSVFMFNLPPIYSPKKPVFYTDIHRDDSYFGKLIDIQPVVDSKMTMKYVKYRATFTSITFPRLKHVVPGKLFENPCAEQPLDSIEQAIGNAINEGARRILTPGFIADPKAYPHRCPRCGASAYVGLMTVDCSRKSCS